MAKKKPASPASVPSGKSSAPSRERRYWLFKTEPTCFSIDDLSQAPKQSTFWDGVRNYQARNFLRDEIKVGDGVLYYHSTTEPMAIVGMAEVIRDGYPDHTAFDPKADHYDPDSDIHAPTWFMVDIQLTRKFDAPLTRAELQKVPALKEMELLRRGSRLSVQRVTPAEWTAVMKLAGVK